MDSERGRKFKERQTDAKKKILEYYFIFRKEIEEKRDFDFQNVIQAYTEILKGMQDKFLATMKPKPEKRIIWLYKRLLKNIKCNSSVTIKDTSEKNTACLTRKNMDRIYSYASLRWIWVKFFMIRRMQNKEILVLLRSFCDADQDSLEYRFITSVKISYPYRLWP